MEDSVQPNDSASNVGSYISSTSSARARVAAHRAALMAQLEGEQRRAELEIERVNLEARLHLNDVKTSLRAATAEEEALEAYETGTVWDQGTADTIQLYRMVRGLQRMRKIGIYKHVSRQNSMYHSNLQMLTEFQHKKV